MALSADSFNRADNPSSLGSTNGAGSLDPLTWTTQSGTCGIFGNQAYGPSGAPAVATVDLATADVDLTLTIITIGSGACLVFRFVNTTNYWIWGAFGTNSQLYKNVAGTFTQVGSNQTGAAVNDVMRVVANGSAIEVFRNGTSKITTTDSTHASATKHGFYSGSSASPAYFDSWGGDVAAVTTTVTGTQATETDSASSGTLHAVASGVIQFIPAVST